MLPLSNSAQELSPVFVSSAYKTLVQQEMPVCSRYSYSLTKESYMENPRKRTTVATAASGDGLHLFDHQQQQTYALNTTSALVWQHCDGQTRPEQLMELLRRTTRKRR
jgi:Coenzyme PQQ synthesis protein D (PqqD)